MAEAQIPHGYKQTEVGVIPEDWEVTTVGNEFSIQLGKMLDSEKNVGVSKPYLGNRAVQWGRIDLSDLGVIKMTPSDLQRFRLRQGDLLVCEGGEIGRAAIWNEPIEECYYQKALHRLRPIRGYNVQLMLNVLQRLASTGFLTNFVTQTSIAHLPKDKFEKVPIPVPPHQSRTRSHRRGLERCGCPHRIPGATHRQKTPDQTRRHAGIAHRQEASAGFQWGMGENTARQCSRANRWWRHAK